MAFKPLLAARNSSGLSYHPPAIQKRFWRELTRLNIPENTKDLFRQVPLDKLHKL